MQQHIVTFFIRRGLQVLGLLLIYLPTVSVGQDHVPQIQIKAATGHYSVSRSPIFDEDLNEFSIELSMGSEELNGPIPQLWNTDMGGVIPFRIPDSPIHTFPSDTLIGPFWNHGILGQLNETEGLKLGEKIWDQTAKANDDPPSIKILEGNSVEYIFSLDGAPSTDVTMIITGFSGTNLTVTPSTFPVAPTDYEDKIITLTADHDSDAINDEVTLTITFNENEGDPYQLDVEIVDDEIIWELEPVTMSEGTRHSGNIDLQSYVIPLLGPPSGDVTVTLTGHEGTSISPNQTTFIFLAEDGWPAQEIYFLAEHDDDTQDEQVTLLFTAMGGGYSGLRFSREIMIEDRPPYEILIPEGTSITAPDLVLFGDTPIHPNIDVIVATYSGYEGTDISVSPSSVSYPSESQEMGCRNGRGILYEYCWRGNRVVFEAAHDADDIDDQVTLTLQVTEPASEDNLFLGIYARFHIRIEDDDVPRLEVSPSSLRIPEGESRSISIRLTREPLGNIGTNDVTVSVSERQGDLIASPSSLIFTSTDWDRPQSVRFTAQQDEDFLDEFQNITVSANGGGYGGEQKRVAITILDDDEPELVVSPAEVFVSEGGSGSQFSVNLAVQPSSTVLVRIASFEDPDLTRDRSSLRFSRSNYNVAQSITVFAAEDVDAVDEIESIRLEATGGGYNGITQTVTVKVNDNDAAGIDFSSSSLNITEGDAENYSVRLLSEPTKDVTIRIVESEDVVTFSPQVLRFSASNWDKFQEVTVRAQTDDNSITETSTLIHTATSSDPDYSGKMANLPIAVVDHETTGIELIPTSLSVEEGNEETYSVRLLSQPVEAVTVNIVESEDVVSFSPPELIFLASNWDQPQVVTVQAVSDDNAISEMSTLIHTSTSSDPDYNGKIATLTVTIIDNDVAGIELIPTSLEVTEEDTEIYTVRLMSAPTGPVTVSIPESEGRVMVSRQEFSFTSSNWNEPQEVTLRANPDDNTINETYTLIHTATSSDPSYNRKTASLSVTVIDNDAAEIQLIPTSLNVTEGDTQIYSVRLQTEPSEPVAVNITESGGVVTVLPLMLRFTSSNWSELQEVTVQSDPDDNTINEVITLIHTASSVDPDYNGKTATLPVTVIDGDRLNLVVNPTELTIEEGTSKEFTVQLSSPSAVPVTVQIPMFTNQDLTHDQSTLTFTSSTWDEPQTVTVSANKDDDAENEDPETLTLTAAGGEYDGITGMVTVTVEDTNQKGILLNPLSLYLEEGGPADTYTVELQSAPTSTMTITVTGHSNKVTLDQESLTFTPSNWNDPQTVTIQALDDQDTDNEQFMLTHSASGGGYDDETASLEVRINDLGILTISIFDAEVSEGGGYVDLQVELSQPVDQLVSVMYQAVAEDAEAGSDYQDSRGIVLFSSGSTKGRIRLDILDDEVPEPDETFAVVLRNARNAEILRGTGRVTILDNDGGLIVWIDDEVALEEDGMVQFSVHLSQPSADPVMVSYRTENGTAIAGEDYQATSGVLMFAPGTIKEEIVVELLTDEFDWREETFTVHLQSLGKTQIEKGVAVATIQEAASVSSEVMKAYTARFIRTSTVQIVEALHQRFQSRTGASSCSAGERMVLAQMWGTTSGWEPSLSELLSGCHLSGTLPGGGLSVWGRGSFTRFNGQGEDALRLRADVTTAMVGMDYTWQRGWLAGLLVSHSQGDGSFDVFEESGDVHSGLTGLVPYISIQKADWGAWMAMGYGQGRTEVQELEGDLVSMFGAAGAHGEWASNASVGLTVHGDILYSGAEVDEHAVSVQVYRVRAGLGSDLRISKVIRPYVEANIRRDGGSAETGTGLELGGGIRLAYPAWRLRGEMRTQGLVIHSANGFTEWGLSGLVQFGDGPEGLVVSVRPSWGPNQGGVLLRQKAIHETTSVGTNHNQIKMEMAYGLPFQAGVMRSVAGMTQLFTGRMYRLGVELQPWEYVNVSMFGVTYPNANSQRGIGLNLRGSLRY